MAVEEVSRPTSSGPAVQSRAVQSRAVQSRAVQSRAVESAVEADPRHVLDRVTWASLAGPHARFAERNGRAIRYHPETAPFVALEDPDDERCWADAADLVGPAGSVVLLPGPTHPPAGWKQVFGEECSLLVETSVEARPDPTQARLPPGLPITVAPLAK